jgi:hypothetical protein
MIVHSHNHRQTRRSRLDAYEVSSTGGLPHIGHLVAYWDEIENWRFGRCRCGFNLALTPTGKVIWLRAANRACEIVSFEHLLRALAADCWHHPRAKPKNADSLSAPTIAAALSRRWPPSHQLRHWLRPTLSVEVPANHYHRPLF